MPRLCSVILAFATCAQSLHAAQQRAPRLQSIRSGTAVAALSSEQVATGLGYLVGEATAGRTPNPDIMCNSRIKFGVFHERIGRHFAHVASGHYARVAADSTGERVQLLRSADEHKDRDYSDDEQCGSVEHYKRWDQRLREYFAPQDYSAMVTPCRHSLPLTKLYLAT